MHDFHPRDRTADRPQRGEAEHGMHDSFTSFLVLLYKGVEIFRLPYDNSRLVNLVIVHDGCGSVIEVIFLSQAHRDLSQS